MKPKLRLLKMPKKKTTSNEQTENILSEDKIIKILEFLGYHKITQGNSYFFLPKRNAIKFEKKLSKEKIMELFKNE